jgi:hypothetical protein
MMAKALGEIVYGKLKMPNGIELLRIQSQSPFMATHDQYHQISHSTNIPYLKIAEC